MMVWITVQYIFWAIIAVPFCILQAVFWMPTRLIWECWQRQWILWQGDIAAYQQRKHEEFK